MAYDRGSPTIRRTAAAALTALGGIAASRLLHRRRVVRERVAPDLRGAAAYASLPLRGPRSLRAIRFLTGLAPSAPPPGAHGEATPGGVSVVLYEPPDRPSGSGALLWLHGGGMVMGGPELGHAECVSLAEQARCLVVSVDYRLAPEHPFPAALDDAYAAFEWLHDEAERLGIDRRRIAVGGDSAGGGLAAALAQRAHDAGRPLAFQLLLYPMLDDRTALRTDFDPEGVFIWSPASNRYAWAAYLGRSPNEEAPPPYAAPARRVDLSGLAPAWIGAGDLDLFIEEDVEYARRLGDAGVPCELHVAPGMWHGAPTVMPDRPTSVAVRRSMAGALVAAIGA